MIREKKKKAAVFLVVCMVLSMFTGIPLNASAQEAGGTGLVVAWADGDQDGNPVINENDGLQKEVGANLYGITVYLGYAADEATEPIPVAIGEISVQYNGADAGDKVEYKANEKNNEFTDFTFYEVGDYTITYNDSSVSVHVDYPEVGFYKTNGPTSDGLIRDGFKYSGSDNTFYMIFHRSGMSKLDLDAIKYIKDGDDTVDISEYLTITAPEFSLPEDASDYQDEENYVYEVQIKEGMAEYFWFNVEVQKTEIYDDDGTLTFNSEGSYPISCPSMYIIQTAEEGLVVARADWDEDGNPFINEYGLQKEAWVDLYGITVYLGYAADEATEPKPVAIGEISVQYNGTAAGDEITYKANEQDSDFIDFEFYKCGNYKITCNGSAVIIHVSYPTTAWCETSEMTESGIIRDMSYKRGTEKTFYVALKQENDIASYSYKINTGYDSNYIMVDGKPLDPEKEMTGPAKITITTDAKGSFDIRTSGTVTYTDGHEEDINGFLWCVDTYEAALIEDGKEHTGFAGCFISQEMYDANTFDLSLTDVPSYWVHADTLQGVVDELVRVAEKGSVTVGGQTYTVKNSGYIRANASYLPKYEKNATTPQYVTTPSDIEGIIIASDFEMYYTEEKGSQGTYYPVKLWKKDSTELYTCMKDGKYYPVTKTEDNVFNLQAGGTGKTEQKMVQDGYVLDEEYGITCQWPELHVDATTNVKIIGNFGEVAEDRANVYLGLYEDSDIVSSIMVDHEEDGIRFKDITKADIGKEVSTAKGVKVKVVKLAAKMDTTVVGDFISADAVTIEGADGQALRDKIDIEEAIASDEELKKAIIDGESLDVSMNMKTVERSEAQAAEGIDKIAALVKSGKNDTSKIQYLDIGLKYQVGKKQGEITETKENIPISIDLPKDFAKADGKSAKSWKPVVYRYHDGKAEKLESTFVNGKLKFATGKFSVYAVAIEEVVPTGIKITTPPTKTKYTVGDKFNKKGMVVQVTYSDGSTKNITDYTVPSAALKTTDKTITVTYGKHTAKQAITVTEVPTKVGDKVTVSGSTYKVTSVKTNNKTVALVAGSKTATALAIPSTVTIKGEKYKVTAIADKACYKNKKLTTVKLSANVTSIGKNAFAGCSKLKKVTLNAKLTTIGDAAFSKCTALTAIGIPQNVKKIGKSAFAGCSKLKKVTLNAKLTTIGDTAFSKCTALTAIGIPQNVKKIGKQAFNGCKKLKTITIKTSKLTTKNVGSNAFKGIYAKATIKVPAKKLASYKRILKAKGVGSKAKIKK